MPEFGSSFSGLANDRKLTHEELVRAIRFAIAAEYEAIQLYMQLAESTDNRLAIRVLKEISDEEKVHAGEFLRLLDQLAPDEKRFYQEGAEEVNEQITKMEAKHEKSEQGSQNRKIEDTEELPYCTTAASAEHSPQIRGGEPCDDGRTGEK